MNDVLTGKLEIARKGKSDLKTEFIKAMEHKTYLK